MVFHLQLLSRVAGIDDKLQFLFFPYRCFTPRFCFPANRKTLPNELTTTTALIPAVASCFFLCTGGNGPQTGYCCCKYLLFFCMFLVRNKKFAGVNKRDVTVAGVDPQHPAGGLMASDPFAVKWKVRSLFELSPTPNVK